MNWRKSSYSSGNGGECVEVASTGVVLVRDTTDRSGPVVAFTTAAWEAFTAKMKEAELDPRATPRVANPARGCFLFRGSGGRWTKRNPPADVG